MRENMLGLILTPLIIFFGILILIYIRIILNVPLNKISKVIQGKPLEMESDVIYFKPPRSVIVNNVRHNVTMMIRRGQNKVTKKFTFVLFEGESEIPNSVHYSNELKIRNRGQVFANSNSKPLFEIVKEDKSLEQVQIETIIHVQNKTKEFNQRHAFAFNEEAVLKANTNRNLRKLTSQGFNNNYFDPMQGGRFGARENYGISNQQNYEEMD